MEIWLALRLHEALQTSPFIYNPVEHIHSVLTILGTYYGNTYEIRVAPFHIPKWDIWDKQRRISRHENIYEAIIRFIFVEGINNAPKRLH